jgi:hypothetical protein
LPLLLHILITLEFEVLPLDRDRAVGEDVKSVFSDTRPSKLQQSRQEILVRTMAVLVAKIWGKMEDRVESA